MTQWVSEKVHLELLGDGVNPELWEEFQDAWYKDLEVLTQAQTKESALSTANAYLKYYGSRVRVSDVSWDFDNRCFLWHIVDKPLDGHGATAL